MTCASRSSTRRTGFSSTAVIGRPVRLSHVFFGAGDVLDAQPPAEASARVDLKSTGRFKSIPVA